jgi:hypothetical protein
MTPDHLRHLLRALRWPPRVLARALAISEGVVDSWLDGTASVPGNVAEWLEALAAVHEGGRSLRVGASGRSVRLLPA